MEIRQDSCYRPYSVVVNNKGYYLSNIHFYNESGVVVSSDWGWLERKNGTDIKSIELPVKEIKLRRKLKFDGVVFAMLHKDLYEIKAELYIPCDMFGIRFTCNKLDKGIWQVRKVYDGEHEIHIEQYVFSVDGKLIDIRDEYDKLYKDCESYNFISNSDKVVLNLDKMRELAEDYKTELARLNSLTIDDIDI
jgi:hypothetical protein